jgi:hypothetical protein
MAERLSPFDNPYRVGVAPSDDLLGHKALAQATDRAIDLNGGTLPRTFLFGAKWPGVSDDAEGPVEAAMNYTLDREKTAGEQQKQTGGGRIEPQVSSGKGGGGTGGHRGSYNTD